MVHALDPSKTILISGAGIGGLCCALFLSKLGFSVVIFEKVEKLEPIGAGLQLSPNAYKLLAELGLAQSLKQSAAFPESIRIHDAFNRTWIPLSVHE